MNIGIGIDTGGTYTDAVAYDYDTAAVLASGKALTTKDDLTRGICAAMDALPDAYLRQAKLVALSTTLSTNACVEGKGGRAKLLLMGTTQKTLDWIGADAQYGLHKDSVLCIDTHGSFDGKIVDEPDYAALIEGNDAWLREADALSVAEVNAPRNGALCERHAYDALAGQYSVPVVVASDLASGLNVMERGATALLNARLLPVIQDFIAAVHRAMAQRGLDIPVTVVRSDGSLMADALSGTRPVETILSGPAASVIGGRRLAHCADCLIVDMGGTTTDISIVKDHAPVMSGGIRIGGWRTQVSGVYMDTFGLGGDSVINVTNQRLVLGTRRAQPLCVAATQWPQIKTALRRLLDEDRTHTHPLHEFLYLAREPGDLSRYTEQEGKIIGALRNGPLMLGHAHEMRLDLYDLKTERLENEGVIMRCGLTPTDFMHIKGDFARYDTDASRLAAQYFLRCMPQYNDDMDTLVRDVYDAVEHKLYHNLVRVLLSHRYPKMYDNGFDEQTAHLVSESWKQYKSGGEPFLTFGFNTVAALVGIGAPTHVFLPDVAKALGAQCVIPEYAGVANAVGAAVADISTTATVEIAPEYTPNGISGYTVYAHGGNTLYKAFDDAVEAAKTAAADEATAEARRRGALGELRVDTLLSSHVAQAKDGQSIDLGTRVIATATGRIS